MVKTFCAYGNENIQKYFWTLQFHLTVSLKKVQAVFVTEQLQDHGPNTL